MTSNIWQETVYQSLHRDAQFDAVKTSSSTTMRDRNGILQRHGNSSQTVNADSQLVLDEAYARELQELENQLSHTSLNRTFGARTGMVVRK